MNKIIKSLSVIAFVAAIALAGTGAYFSDSETSTGNTFTAGAIDLKIDNESYVTDSNGELVASPNTSWELDDLTGQLFFNFSDLKPGDIGEDTISLHVDSNDAYLCAAVRITDDSDQSCTEPELEDDTDCSETGNDNGELDENLKFAFWADDGDNVYEDGENIIKKGTLSDLGNDGQIALADSKTNVWDSGTGALPGGTTKYIGKAWCFGDLKEAKVASGDYSNGPLTTTGGGIIGTGFTCDGANVNNASQTDRVMGDIQFYVEQARNNPNFTCANNYDPNYPGTRTLILENKDSNWKAIDSDTTKGILTYHTAGDTFTGTFEATGLNTSYNSYSLIYYADKPDRFNYWGGDNPGAVIATFTASNGIINSTDIDVDLGMDLPSGSDWNAIANPDYCTTDGYNTCRGAKIWLVPTSALTGGSLPVSWGQHSSYLYETDLINYNDTNN